MWCDIGLLSLFVGFVLTGDSYSHYKRENIKIKLNSGILQGNTKVSKDGRLYYNFQGIPFALPPLGDLRFKDPVPFKTWNGILNATAPRSNCVEIAMRQINFEVSGNEDCLYLNVFAPQNPKKNIRRLPVMVWLYGGSFREGGANIYEPDYLINDDVILVTFNYRLGFFGFLSTEDSNAPGNYGMKDIVLALRWVKSNIDRFGGDRNMVTVFGESAGAAAVGYLLLSPLGKGLFDAAIMQSGTPLCVWALHRNPRKVAFDLGIAMGITTNSSEKLVKYLRGVDLASASDPMVKVILLNFGDSFQGGGPFGPVVEPNLKNAFLNKDSYAALKNGNFIKVPVLMGVNSQEGKFFTSIMPLARPLFFLYDVSPSLLIRETMNIRASNDKRIVSKKINQYYFGSHSFVRGSDKEYSQFLSDDLFVRPIVKTAKFLSLHVPVYFYVYDFEGSFGKWWLNYAAKDVKDVRGVAHATEVWYLWRTNLNNLELEIPDEKRMSQRLVRLWTNFAKYRNPTHQKEILLENLTWPKLNGINMDYFYIGKDLKIGKNFNQKSINFWESLYKNYSKGPYETY